MKTKIILSQIFKYIFAFFLAIFISSLGFGASAVNTINGTEVSRIENESNCPDSIINYAKELQANGSLGISDLEGSFIVGRDKGGNLVIYCPVASDFEQIIVRGIVFLVGAAGGLVWFFALGKAGFLIMTAGTDGEKSKKGKKSLVTVIMYGVGGVFAYVLLIFFIVGSLGVGTSRASEWNIICQQRIVFYLTFTNDLSSATVDGRDNPNICK